jgi:hypothetical protein
VSIYNQPEYQAKAIVGRLLEGEVVQADACREVPTADAGSRRFWLLVRCPSRPTTSVDSTRCSPDSSGQTAGWVEVYAPDGYKALRPVQDEAEGSTNFDHHEGVLTLSAWLCSETRTHDPLCKAAANATTSLHERLENARDVLETSLKVHFRFASVAVWGHVYAAAAPAEGRRLTDGDSADFKAPDHFEVAFTARGGSTEYDADRARLHFVLQGYLDDALVGAGIMHASTMFCSSESEHRLCPPSEEPTEPFPLMIVMFAALGGLLLVGCCIALVCLATRRNGKPSPFKGSSAVDSDPTPNAVDTTVGDV